MLDEAWESDKYRLDKFTSAIELQLPPLTIWSLETVFSLDMASALSIVHSITFPIASDTPMLFTFPLYLSTGVVSPIKASSMYRQRILQLESHFPVHLMRRTTGVII